MPQILHSFPVDLGKEKHNRNVSRGALPPEDTVSFNKEQPSLTEEKGESLQQKTEVRDGQGIWRETEEEDGLNNGGKINAPNCQNSVWYERIFDKDTLHDYSID